MSTTAGINTNSLHNFRILLAEDNPDHQPLVSRMLGNAGASVTIVENGEAAVDLVRDAEKAGNQFDVILMDMQMPILDGYNAARRIRQIGLNTPILAVTGRVLSTEREKCIEAGCDDFLAKPFHRADLIAKVACCVREKAEYEKDLFSPSPK